jgi:hypothetical protein
MKRWEDMPLVSRIVDGGYYENSGTFIAGVEAKVLSEQRLRSADSTGANAARARKAKIFVLVLRSDRCEQEDDPEDLCEHEREFRPEGGMNEILSPIRALLNTRVARADYSRVGLRYESESQLWTFLAARHALREQRCKNLRRTGDAACMLEPADGEALLDKDQISVAELRFDARKGTQPVPLTWVLSSQARREIDDAVDTMLEAELTKYGAIVPKGLRYDHNLVSSNKFGLILQALADTKPPATGAADGAPQPRAER